VAVEICLIIKNCAYVHQNATNGTIVAGLWVVMTTPIYIYILCLGSIE